MIDRFFKDIRPGNCLTAVLGSAVLAFGLLNIHSISGVTEGGVLGLTLLLHHHFGISPSVSGLVLNALCYLLGIKILGRSFLICSALAGGGFSLFYALFERIGPLYPPIAHMPLAAAVIGAVFVGVGVGLCVRAGSAPTGDDALALSLSRRFGFGIQWVYLASDLIVLLLSLSYIPLRTIAYSLLTVVLSGQLVGFVERAGNKKKTD